jgi:hypothetical protein
MNDRPTNQTTSPTAIAWHCSTCGGEWSTEQHARVCCAAAKQSARLPCASRCMRMQHHPNYHRAKSCLPIDGHQTMCRYLPVPLSNLGLAQWMPGGREGVDGQSHCPRAKSPAHRSAGTSDMNSPADTPTTKPLYTEEQRAAFWASGA